MAHLFAQLHTLATIANYEIIRETQLDLRPFLLGVVLKRNLATSKLPRYQNSCRSETVAWCTILSGS